MNALLFLTGKSFVNYFRRAVKSPQRLIGLLLIGAYYFQYFFRYLFNFSGPSYSQSRYYRPSVNAPQVPLDRVEGAIFWVFVFMSLMLFLGSLTPRGGFRPADVDLLFPTPVPSRVVLGFRLIRDGLASLIFPMLLAVGFVLRPQSSGIARFVQGSPEGAGTAFRLFGVAYLLIALFFVATGYAVSLFISRDSDVSDRNRKIANGLIGGVLLGTAAYVGFAVYQTPGILNLLKLSHDPVVRTIFFIPTDATELSIAPLQSSIGGAVMGLAGLLIASGTALYAAFAQSDFLYDQAAQRANRTPTARSAHLRNDPYAQTAEMARRRPAKPRSSRWFARWTPRGAMALVWKDLLLQTRTTVAPFVLVAVMAGMFTALCCQTGTGEAAHDSVLIVAAIATLLYGIMSGTAGFTELLRRGDLQKPLPFSSIQILGLEVVSKAVPAFILNLIVCVITLALAPAAWDSALAVLLMGPALVLPVLAVGVLVLLIFPDVDDVAQRSFRQFMAMLGSAVALVPGALVIGVMLLLKVSLLVALLPFIAVCVGAAFAAITPAAGLYSSFNPND